jgi:hypothetical protein
LDNLKKIVAFGTTLMAMLPALAQDVGGPEAEETELRRYTVEVIIFRYAQDVSVGSEVFSPDEPESEVEPGLEADAAEGPESEPPPPVEESVIETLEQSEPMPDTELVLLEEDDYSLTDVLDKLDLLDVYEPLMHFGWTQAALEQEQTPPLDLMTLGVPPAELAGTFTLYLGRYLHLVVDLQLDAVTPGEETLEELEEPLEVVPTYGDYRSLGETFDSVDDEPAPGPVRYRITEDRIVKNGDLRYFDHPKFGVLARVTRVEDAAEVVDETAVEELLGYPPE